MCLIWQRTEGRQALKDLKREHPDILDTLPRCQSTSLRKGLRGFSPSQLQIPEIQVLSEKLRETLFAGQLSAS